LQGAVQGVGFRPFAHRLATGLGLHGWVHNSTQGLVIEVEGPPAALQDFRERLESERPPGSMIHSLESQWLDPVGHRGFEIRPSDPAGRKTAFIMPDLATCSECLREIFDPANRRYRYPFTNCTHCGPRYSIIHALPYDRQNTTMSRFTQCALCEAEFQDPVNRRFHAQPNACPECGPRLAWWNAAGEVIGSSPSGGAAPGLDPLQRAAAEIRAGKIVALKGLGGFHLMVEARNPEAIRMLRARKHREEKPFALMFPSLDWVRRCCEVSGEEARLLQSPQAPIVLLRRRTDAGRHQLPDELAVGNPCLGVMLPYTPLHHLLMRDLDFPVVATSGNVSDEPICIDEKEALVRLRGIADGFLVHDRPIERHVDDSVARIALGRELILRRARGYAPLPISLPEAWAQGPDVFGVGAHLKNTVALGIGAHVWISQHIGDLETLPAHEAFENASADIQRLYHAQVETVCADLHPNYLSTRYARRLTDPRAGATVPVLKSVQHHLAHVLGCMVENELHPPVLGVAWDGTGYGTDGTIWGGEFLLVEPSRWRRVAQLRGFGLPGGEQAVREPRRTAFGLLHELLGDNLLTEPLLPYLEQFTALERKNYLAMLKNRLNAPRTSSAGRLFDAIAALLGLRQVSHFEGQAAMELEFAAATDDSHVGFPFEILTPEPSVPLVLDWGPMIREMLRELQRGEPVAELAARAHVTLADMIVAVAGRIGIERVVLSGGCFQNVRLLEQSVRKLERAGFKPYWHQRVPPNDGGIALGQVVGARADIV